MPVNTAQVDAFARRLAAAASGVEALEELWQDQWGSTIADDMRDLAPRDSGALADSIGYDGEGRVTVGVSYGIYVEYGTTRQSPQPYMRPSVDKNRPLAARDAGRKALDLI